MAVFGTATKGANILSSQRHVQNGGLKKSGKTRNGISRNTKPSEKRGGILLTVWECQLKPRKREQTLEGILLLLQKIYLDLQKKPIITPYTPPATEFPIVAETAIALRR